MNRVKILLTLALSLIALGASAQFSVKAGYTRMAFNGKGAEDTPPPELSMMGFELGASYDVVTKAKGLSFRPGLGFARTKGKTGEADWHSELSDKSSRWTEQSVKLSLDVRYALEVAKHLKIYAYAGPGVSFGISFIEEATFTRIHHNEKVTVKHNMYNGTTESSWNGADGAFIIGMSNIGIVVKGGLGIQFKRVFAEVDYAYDLMDRNTRLMSTSSIRANILTACLGVMF